MICLSFVYYLLMQTFYCICYSFFLFLFFLKQVRVASQLRFIILLRECVSCPPPAVQFMSP